MYVCAKTSPKVYSLSCTGSCGVYLLTCVLSMACRQQLACHVHARNNALGQAVVCLALPPCRSFEAAVSLGNGQKLVGTGTWLSAVGPLPLVYSGDLAVSDTSGNTTLAELCAPGSLNASKVTGPVIVVSKGRIVLCYASQGPLAAAAIRHGISGSTKYFSLFKCCFRFYGQKRCIAHMCGLV